MDREYLSPAEVCEIIPGMTDRTLEEMRARRRAGVQGAKAGPPYSQPSRVAIVYSRTDVVEYLAAIRE